MDAEKGRPGAAHDKRKGREEPPMRENESLVDALERVMKADA